MAANPILAALAGVNTNALETPYGLGLQGLAVAAPKMFNPYASTGQSLGVALGTGLTSALLAYQARKQADEENMAMQPLILQALSAKNPEDVLKVTSAPGGEKLRNFALQTYLSKLEKQQAQEATAEERKADLAKALIGSQNISPEQAIKLASGEPLSSLTTEGIAAAPASPVVEKLAEEEMPQSAPKIEALPDPYKVSAREFQAAKDRIGVQQKQYEMWDAKRKEKKDDFRNAAKDLDSDRWVSMNYEPIISSHNQIKQLIKDRGGINKLTQLDVNEIAKKVIKMTDASQITLGEFAAYAKTLGPIQERWKTQLESLATGSSPLPQSAIKEIVDYADSIAKVGNEAYNDKAAAISSQYGIEDSKKLMRAVPYKFPVENESSKAQELQQLRDEYARLKAAKGIK